MTEPQWVSSAVALAVHRMLLAEHGGLPGLRDEALLESALARPRQQYAYEPTASLFDLAASYGHGLIRNHPFADGNKRVALVVAALFLEINGWQLVAPEPETALVFEKLAADEIDEAGLARWLREHAVKPG